MMNFQTQLANLEKTFKRDFKDMENFLKMSEQNL